MIPSFLLKILLFPLELDIFIREKGIKPSVWGVRPKVVYFFQGLDEKSLSY